MTQIRFNTLQRTAGELEYQANPTDFLFALKFESNRKANFQNVVNLCSRATVFEAVNVDEKKRHAIYFVAFNKAQANLASLTLEEMRQASWRYTLFANGRIVHNKISMLNMIECYCTAKKLKNTKAHCRVVRTTLFDRPQRVIVRHSNVDPVDGEPWLVPCALIADELQLDVEDTIEPVERLEALAIKRGANLCPLFDATAFQKLKKSDKKFW